MSNTQYVPFKVKDISLAEWGRKEIKTIKYDFR